MRANDHQVRGRHYQLRAIQPRDFIAANGLDFFEGNAVKYIARWRYKGGVDDLRKARHYLDKLIELETADVDPDPPERNARARVRRRIY